MSIFIDNTLPRSKAAIKKAIAAGAEIVIEATSFFGDEYDGPVAAAPDGTYRFVGPDPHTSRNYYGTLTVSGGRVTIK